MLFCLEDLAFIFVRLGLPSTCWVMQTNSKKDVGYRLEARSFLHLG